MIPSTLAKASQRRLLTFVNTRWGCTLIVACCLVIVLQTIALMGEVWRVALQGPCANPYDNIGGTDLTSMTCIPHIDAVYTWVNGSDPIWKARMEAYKSAWLKQRDGLDEDAAEAHVSASASSAGSMPFSNTSSPPNDTVVMRETVLQAQQRIAAMADIMRDMDSEILAMKEVRAHNRTNVTLVEEGNGALPSFNTSTEVPQTVSSNNETFLSIETSQSEGNEVPTPTPTPDEEEEETTGSSNRYRDNNELRYSIRSLKKYAPWLRHIHLVTDDQIPSWINVENPRLSIVPHAAIFPNPADLPVFSSPAIEVNLHRIPNLAPKFVYFNDDVMLGAPTWPDDFFTPSGGQKVYLSWDVPQCSKGCVESWITDGFCDKACNNTACDFDGGDCTGDDANTGRSSSSSSYKGRRGSNSGTSGGSGSRSKSQQSSKPCRAGCPHNWIGDNTCDSGCNHVECGFDGGECGLEKLQAAVMSTVIVSEVVLPTETYAQYDNFEMPQLSSLNSSPDVNSTAANATNFTDGAEVSSEVVTKRKVPLVKLPAGTRVAYLNLSTFVRGEERVVGAEKRRTLLGATHDGEGLVAQSLLRTSYDLLVIVFGDEAPWAGDEVELGGLKCYPENGLEGSFLRGCPEPGKTEGCTFHDTLEAAQKKCNLLGPMCGGITLRDGSYETRAGGVPFDSPEGSGERSWVKEECPMPNPMACIALEARWRKINFVLRYALVGEADEMIGTTKMDAGGLRGEAAFAANSGGELELEFEITLEMPPCINVTHNTSLSLNPVARAERIYKTQPKRAAMLSSAGPREMLLRMGAIADPEGDGVCDMTHFLRLIHAVLPFWLQRMLPVEHFKNLSPDSIEDIAISQWTQITEQASNELIYRDGHFPSEQNEHALVPMDYFYAWFIESFDQVHGDYVDFASQSNDEDVDSGEDEDDYKKLLNELFAEPSLSELIFSVESAAAGSARSATDATSMDTTRDEQPNNRSTPDVASSLSNSSDAEGGPASSNSFVHNRRRLTVSVSTIDSLKGSASTGGASQIPTGLVKSSAGPRNTKEDDSHEVLQRQNALLKRRFLEAQDEYLSTHERIFHYRRRHAIDDFFPEESAHSQRRRLQSEDGRLDPSHPMAFARALTRNEAETSNKDGMVPWVRWALGVALSLTPSSFVAFTSTQPTPLSPVSEGVKLAERSQVTKLRGRHLTSEDKNERTESQRIPRVSYSRCRKEKPDTYGDSLKFVNRLYRKAFGPAKRKAPAHMPVFSLSRPHMIDVSDMEALQARWPELFEATSSHRFRHSEDMQFAFAYFYWLVHQADNPMWEPNEFFTEELDQDNDGVLNENELRTLSAVIAGDVPNGQVVDDLLRDLRPCLAPATTTTSERTTEEGRVFTTQTSIPHVTLQRFMNCSDAVDGVREKSRRKATHEIIELKEVAFEMVGDDYNDTKRMLDSVRQRKSKFICINDDMKDPSDAVAALLADFFEAMFPVPSQFERPAESPFNEHLRLPEYLAASIHDSSLFAISLWLTQSRKLAFRAQAKAARQRKVYFLVGVCAIAALALGNAIFADVSSYKRRTHEPGGRGSQGSSEDDSEELMKLD